MKRFLVTIWFLVFVCFILAWKGHGATNTVSDLTYTNVLAQVNAASTGDWVVLTNGNVGWTNTVTITNGSAYAPTNIGAYAVEAIIANTGYYGTNTATLTIASGESGTPPSSSGRILIRRR